MQRAVGQGVAGLIPIGKDKGLQRGALRHQLSSLVAKMSVDDQNGGGGIANHADHFLDRKPMIDRHGNRPDHRRYHVHFDNPVRVQAQIRHTVTGLYAQLLQLPRNRMDAAVHLGPVVVAPFEMGGAPVGALIRIFAYEVWKTDHFRPPSTERPMISRITSPVPPAIRPTRASAHARAIGYSHI